MKISIITLFPQLFETSLITSILGRALKKKLWEYEIIDLRQFGEGKHQIVDGRVHGGGVGIVLRADILAKAWKSIKAIKPYTILMSASGIPFKQKKASELSKIEHLIIVCGHYEGVDQRFIEKYVDEEISIGDYILTGGEIPALVITDAIVRLIPGVLKKEEATQIESFSDETSGLLEYPQYTKPEDFEDLKVPETLLSGNHQKIAEWRKQKSHELTKKVRPELIDE